MSGILYIGQEGTSGYANACKGYIYNLLKNNINVSWKTISVNNKVYYDTCNYDEYISSIKNKKIKYDQVIIHSPPNYWKDILSDIPTKNKTIIGRTVWEYEVLPSFWIDCINSSSIDIVSVPTEWNKRIFIKNKIIKPIIVEPHVYVNFPYIKSKIKDIIAKSCLIRNNKSKVNTDNCYKFYTIGEMSERKGIKETVEAFCKSFSYKDNVCLFLKTFKEDYSIKNKKECLIEIKNICKKYNHADIIYINEELTYDEIKSLHEICDCYVQLTKTEGFGLGIFDAHNSHNKIIVTGYGGHMEYLTGEHVNFIDYTINNLNTFKFNWANPDKNHSIELFQKVANHDKYSTIKQTVDKINVSIFDQHKNVEILNFPYRENEFFFNSCIFKKKEQTYIMTRHTKLGFGINNTIKLFEFGEKLKEIPLNIKNEVENEQYEDPRVLFHDNKFYVGCANYKLNSSSKIHQKILIFDSKFKHIGNIHPVYDGNEKDCLSNTKHQKNWTYFIHNNKILCVYKMSPHVVLEFDINGKLVAEYITHVDINSVWKFGEPRMGSNPILVNGEYHNFFHSSIPWKNNKRQYFMGYYKFEANPPFKITEISKKPIIWGNEVDKRILPNFNPIVVFPCGSVYDDGKFFVSFGFNDEKTGIIKI